mmetsp:Transcript_173/g.416  ORF Transcript_173/g.416 Transcript_173/m.416 type:complete len:232 (+) Transcript_173:1328-2023(+)
MTQCLSNCSFPLIGIPSLPFSFLQINTSYTGRERKRERERETTKARAGGGALPLHSSPSVGMLADKTQVFLLRCSFALLLQGHPGISECMHVSFPFSSLPLLYVQVNDVCRGLLSSVPLFSSLPCFHASMWVTMKVHLRSSIRAWSWRAVTALRPRRSTHFFFSLSLCHLHPHRPSFSPVPSSCLLCPLSLSFSSIHRWMPFIRSVFFRSNRGLPLPRLGLGVSGGDARTH